MIYKTRYENLDVKRAVIFYKVITQSYGSGGKSLSSQSYSVRKTFQNVERCSCRLSSVFIENKDFEELIVNYDRENALFYTVYEME